MAAESEMEWVRRNGKERMFLSSRQQRYEMRLPILTLTCLRAFRGMTSGLFTRSRQVVG